MTARMRQLVKVPAAFHSCVRRTGVVMMMVATAAACSKSPSQPSPVNPTPGPATVTSVVVTGALSLSEGATTQLVATATLSDGSQQNVTNQATWASATQSVATVSATGVLTTLTTGTADISAAYQGRTGRATAQVSRASWGLDLVVESVTALDTCDDVIQGLNSGEFAVRVLAIETDGSQTTLASTTGYPGNPDNLRVFNLGRNESQSINARRTFTVAGQDGQYLRLQFNATEWDEQVVLIPPSTRWVPDSNMNNRSTNRTHTFTNGAFSGLGPNTLTIGNSSCGLRLNYSLSATRQ